ncbi:phosphatidylinositol 4-phosphate 5-kinase type-1 alpha-like [Homalodisca vitripennis]|uniref:phosphatidylinositol 4-phosphate 5-kinase type-1 alpha-like n=1 Tax=Homalodisca vitripennis TaxID=197043 RepID=UPI001EEC4853|nr:phosphatidylinositol 4-phosphate 5-kinase type-1 alpha-like [Homalodisca vitripennis]KAG8296596.1 Phosphatidylinositol 4-phosphate 5-kinase type-1 beta [Homalodisca vitripennis]
MGSGDSFYMESGDIIDILRNESYIADEIYIDIRKIDGVSKRSVGQYDMYLKSMSINDNKCNQEKKETSRKITKERKLGHRRVHSDGGVSFKNINTSRIMNSIQLGIQRSVGMISTNPDRDVLMDDFMTVESTIIRTDEVMQSAEQQEFSLKTYAPVAFRYFRDLFGIKTDHFLSSFCKDPLKELPNPGASGSVFYVTQNDEFIMKTMQHKEAEFLQKLLPGYYLNLNQNPRTLLPKFFGLYCYKCNSKNVRTVVMNNVLPSSLKIHQKYDLKGSTFNRKSSKEECAKASPTFKDIDFINHHPEGIFLEAEAHRSLVKAIQRDCRVLESFQIIDYSLLLGIHNLDKAKREETQNENEGVGSKKETVINASGDGCLDDVNEIISVDSEIQVKDENTSCATFEVNNVDCDIEKKFTLTGVPARQANGENLLLFVGIIDILQSYKLKKRLEHVWKSIVYDSDTVSVHNPRFYSQRFQDFITKTVFKTTPVCSETAKKKAVLRSKP